MELLEKTNELTLREKATSAGRVKILSATFAVSKNKMSRGDAWDLCRRQSRQCGIPEHAWTKRHGNGEWSWYTCSFRSFKYRDRCYRSRLTREQNL